jgi:uncharacterized protein YndB with AHSA1/START domain
MRECASAGVAEGVVPGTDEDDFVVNRVFEAPRDLVFRAMTEPAHLERWFGPPGTKIRVVSSDLKPGGQLRYAMPEGAKETFGRFVYREIAPPGRLAYVVSFADEKFAPTRHPLSKAWPLEVLAIETLGSFDGKTLFFSRTIPIYATQEERETFRAGHSSMVQGLKGALDQLDEYLKTLR